MNENEIIKALECCISEEVQGCKDCPLLEFSRDCDECRTELMKQALDIIKRKNAENEGLKCRNQNLTFDLTSAKAEIEAFKESIREHAEMLAERDVQIRMLQKENEAFAPLGMLYSEIKSEARKEFVERLKAKLTYKGKNTKYGDFTWGDIKSYELDNLLAEMESERG